MAGQSRKRISILLDRATGPTARQGIGALLDQGLASLANFLTTIVVGRACTPAQLGYYSLGASVVMFVFTVQRSLVITPYIVTAARLRGRPLARYTGSALLHNAVLCAIAMLAAFVMSVIVGLIPSGGNLSAVLRLLSVALAFITLRRLARMLCYARLRLGLAILMDVAVLVLQMGGLALLWQAGVVSAETAYWMVGMASGIVGTAWLVGMGKRISFSARHVRVHWRRNWAFARWLLVGTLAFSTSTYLYPWLLTWFHGAGAVGVLQACLSIAYLANPFIYGTGNLLVAKCAHALARGGMPALRRTVRLGTLVAGGGMVALGVVIVVGGRYLIVLLFGPEYGGHTPTLAVLALSQFASGLTVAASGGLLALRRSDLMLSSYLAALAVTLTAGPWLARGLGPTGVAFGMLACSSAMLLLRTVAFHRLAAQSQPAK